MTRTPAPDPPSAVSAAGRLAARAAEPPDLRLAGLAVAAWLTALVGLYLSARTMMIVVVLAATGALGAAAYLIRARHAGRPTRRHIGRPTRAGGSSGPRPVASRPVVVSRALMVRHGWVAVAVLLGAVCGAAATAARLGVRDAEPIAELIRERVTVTAELVVRDDPRAVSGAAGRPSMYLVSAELSWLRGSGPAAARVKLPARILVLATNSEWRHLLPGQRLTARGRLGAPNGGDLTAAVLSANTAPVPLGQPSLAQRIAGSLRAGLQRACTPLPDEPGGLLPGLVVGDTSRLLPEVENNFQITGMTHLNAVSGSNVAIVIGFVLLLARWGRAGPWLSAGLCGLALVGFVILVRPSPSVVRAATMGAIGLLGLAVGRPRAALPALCGAITVLIVLDPELAGDAGFTLSVLATGGLLLIAPRWRDGLRRRGVPPGVAEALAVPAAAQLACTPVVAGLSGTISLVAVPANLLAVPAVAPATVFGVGSALVSPVWPAGAEFLAWLGNWPAWWLVLVARYGAQLPAGTLPWISGVAGGLLLGALTVALMIAARHPLVRRLVAIVTVAVVIGVLPVRLVTSGWPPTGWVIVACAVGQGDSIVLPAGAGSAVVIDAGPDPLSADRCLRRLGIRNIPLLLITHFHADHAGGVAGVFRKRRVAAVATPHLSDPAAGLDAVRRAAAAGGTPMAAIEVGWTYAVGPIELALIGPPYPLRGTNSDPNNNSLVIVANVRGVRIMLPGDAETEEQQALLDRMPATELRADVLKVAHHGSAYQEPRFLDAVDPAVALVSVGVDNGYGHPNPAMLTRLTRAGVRVLRTDTDGDAAAVIQNGRLAVAKRGLSPTERPR